MKYPSRYFDSSPKGIRLKPAQRAQWAEGRPIEAVLSVMIQEGGPAGAVSS